MVPYYADSRGLLGGVSAMIDFLVLFERVLAPCDFATEVFGHDYSDNQATNIFDRKVTVQILLDVYPIIHEQPQYELSTRIRSQSDFGYKHSLQPARADFTEQLLHVRRMECFALVIGQG